MVVCIVCGCFQVVAAQDNEAPDLPCHRIDESSLALFEGQWTVAWTYRTSPGEYVESTAEATIEQDLLGCVLIERFEGMLEGRPFAAMTLFSQKSADTFDRILVDTAHGSFSQYEGVQQGDTLIYSWQRDLGERVLRTRHTYIATGEDVFLAEFHMSRSEGSPWELVERAHYRRR